VIVDLGNGISVAAVALATGMIRMKNALVGIRVFCLKPGKKRGAEIETGSFEIINDLDDPALGVQGTGAGIRMIALVMNAFIPVVKGSGTILLFDLFDPGILAGRLIKMPVKTDANFFGHKENLPSTDEKEALLTLMENYITGEE